MFFFNSKDPKIVTKKKIRRLNSSMLMLFNEGLGCVLCCILGGGGSIHLPLTY